MLQGKAEFQGPSSTPKLYPVTNTCYTYIAKCSYISDEIKLYRIVGQVRFFGVENKILTL